LVPPFEHVPVGAVTVAAVVVSVREAPTEAPFVPIQLSVYVYEPAVPAVLTIRADVEFAATDMAPP
jgi:hypothetical protein